MVASRKKNTLEKIWEGPPSPSSPSDKASVQELQKKIQHKLQTDKEALKKALQIISEWINKTKK